MARIAVVHVPFYSHFRAATRLSAALVERGHSIVAWAPAACREPTEEIGAEFRVHEPEMPDASDFESFAAAVAEATERYTEPIIDELFECDVDLLLHDSQTPWARIAGDYLGIPRIVLHPMFPQAVAVSKASAAEQAGRIVVGDPRARFEQSSLSIARRWGVELGQPHMAVHSSSDHSGTTLTFTTEEILGPGLPPGWHCVGPMMDPLPAAAPDGGRPLVYACFGTSFNRRPHLFSAVIEGLADEPFDVLISTGRGPVEAEELGPLPANVEVRDFVDGRDVLRRASVHISHCGCNSVHESLLAGVPLVCMPQAYDQFPLAGRLAGLGAGRFADETARDVRAAVRHLLEDPGPRRRARELGDHLASYDGAGRTNAVVDRVLAEHAVLSVCPVLARVRRVRAIRPR